MWKVIILVCSLVEQHPYGCGPNTGHADKPIEVGTAATQGECFVSGRKALAAHPDTDKVYHKVICVKS